VNGFYEVQFLNQIGLLQKLIVENLGTTRLELAKRQIVSSAIILDYVLMDDKEGDTQRMGLEGSVLTN
jgi:hypothetical protein